jgi:hypothetical protein
MPVAPAPFATLRSPDQLTILNNRKPTPRGKQEWAFCMNKRCADSSTPCATWQGVLGRATRSRGHSMQHSSLPEVYIRELRDGHTIGISKTSLYAPVLALRWLVSSVLDPLAVFHRLLQAQFACELANTYLHGSASSAPRCYGLERKIATST